MVQRWVPWGGLLLGEALDNDHYTENVYIDNSGGYFDGGNFDGGGFDGGDW